MPTIPVLLRQQVGQRVVLFRVKVLAASRTATQSQNVSHTVADADADAGILLLVRVCAAYLGNNVNAKLGDLGQCFVGKVL